LLDPAALVGVEVPNGLSKATLRITVGGRRVTAEVNAKSLRRAVTAINATGPDSVAVVVQGELDESIITEADISAQPKAQKAAA
jgi:hypothetical protein